MKIATPGYGHEVALPSGFAAVDQDLLSDPQTSGGLLVSCGPQAVAAVLEIFAHHGFGAAAEIGEVCARQVQNPGMGLQVV